jgi:hypothetical protein
MTAIPIATSKSVALARGEDPGAGVPTGAASALGFKWSAGAAIHERPESPSEPRAPS